MIQIRIPIRTKSVWIHNTGEWHWASEGRVVFELEAGQVIPCDEDEAGGGPQLHEEDPVHGAERGGVLVLHAHPQRLHSLLQGNKL